MKITSSTICCNGMDSVEQYSMCGSMRITSPNDSFSVAMSFAAVVINVLVSQVREEEIGEYLGAG